MHTEPSLAGGTRWPSQAGSINIIRAKSTRYLPFLHFLTSWLAQIMRYSIIVFLTVVSTASFSVFATPEEDLNFFESKIRPVLVEHCYTCHSAAANRNKKLKGGLLLDTQAGTLAGGESGPAIVPGNPAESLLIAALRHETFEMPPSGKLPDDIISDFEAWIARGAADPRQEDPPDVVTGIDLDAGRQHWSFQPLQELQPPHVDDEAWLVNDVDRFIRHQQELVGISPNQFAPPETLLRRAYFDLVGLPPEPQAVVSFMAEAQHDFPGAYNRLITELLNSPHFGERWARHWLDISRFAESNGYAFDGDRPFAFHFRDFVIRAFNEDLPFTEFVRRQIAGDLLADPAPQTTAASVQAIQLNAASGFLVAGTYTTQQTQKERERSRYEQLDDVIHTLGTAFLGLTVGCSRCHDHKYDPLPQKDYYRLAACFADVGFVNTGVNKNPPDFHSRKAAFDEVHAPLATALSTYETEALPANFQLWSDHKQGELNQVAELELRVLPWSYAGPFTKGAFEQVLAEKFGPEEAVDLAATYGDIAWSMQDWADATIHNPFTGRNTAHYLHRIIESPRQEQVRFSLGSDDALKFFVNGKELLSQLVTGAAAADEAFVTATLQQGPNEILMKVVNQAGPSGFYFAVQPMPAASATFSHWHHLGPFPSGGDQRTAHDRIFDPEKKVDLEQASLDGQLHWKEQPDWTDGVVHMDKLTGTMCANYLYRTIESPSSQVLSLSLGSDDSIVVWVNGRKVLDKFIGRTPAAADQEKVEVQIAAGTNTLLMKICNGAEKTGFYFQATASAPAADIQGILATDSKTRNNDQRQKILDWYKGYDLGWLALNAPVERHNQEAPQPEMEMVFAARKNGETYQFGDNTYKVFHLARGNSDNKLAEAAPGLLRVLTPTETEASHFFGSSGDADQAATSTDVAPVPRLALANWLTDTDSGAGALLARVIVNRLWHQHFGRGLVATPSDFGTRGEKPSHPELLDWLAAELIRNHWQLKPLHHMIMTSATYMQAGASSPTAQRLDPENLLLWRRATRRLEAEIIRDSLLCVSGLLDRTSYGKGTLDPNSPRRSIYLTTKRSQLMPLLQLFDAPDTMQGVGSRQQSTVAPQALAMLNSPIVRGWATQFAHRLRSSPDTSVTDAIHKAYEVAFARSPSEAEALEMAAFVNHQKTLYQDAALAEQMALRDFCHLLLCSNEFVYVD